MVHELRIVINVGTRARRRRARLLHRQCETRVLACKELQDFPGLIGIRRSRRQLQRIRHPDSTTSTGRPLWCKDCAVLVAKLLCGRLNRRLHVEVEVHQHRSLALNEQLLDIRLRVGNLALVERIVEPRERCSRLGARKHAFFGFLVEQFGIPPAQRASEGARILRQGGGDAPL